MEIALFVWFYLYAGLMFGNNAGSLGLFDGVSAPWKVLLWPLLTVKYVCDSVKDGGFARFVRYCLYKMKNPGV